MHQDWFGAIAQLVERLNGIQEVRGSTPLGSTIFLNEISMLRGLIFESERPLTLAVPNGSHSWASVGTAFSCVQEVRTQSTSIKMGQNCHRSRTEFNLTLKPRANHSLLAK